MKTKQTFEEHLRKSNLSENTITSYLWTVNYYHSHYDEVNKENLLAYKGYLMEFFKPKTVNLRIQGINKYLEFLGKEKLQLKAVKVQQKNFLENVISNADYNYLKKQLKKDGNMEWYFVVWYLAATGARVSELIQIKIEHIEIGYFDLYNLMREAIDKALTMSTNPKVFTYVMKQLGYVIDLNPYHKYATIRSVNSKKATRLYRLGEAYDRDAIYDRMRDTLRNNPQEAYRLYYEFTEKKSFGVTIQKAHFVKGNLKTAKKITGLKALYFRYLYLLGVLPKNKKHKPLSPEMREACRWLDCHTAQVQLICDNHLTDISSVEVFIKNTDSEIKLISDYRKMLYRDIDSCHNPDEKAKLVAKRDDCTKVLTQLRKDRKIAARIIEDNPKIKENILIEENMRSRYFGLNKSRKRGYER